MLLHILKTVQTEYKGVRKLDDPTVNPVHKALLLTSDHEGQLIIEELFDKLEQSGVEAGTADDENSSLATPEALNGRQSRHSSEIQTVFAHLMMIQKQNEEITNEIQAMRTTFSKKLGYLQSTVDRLTVVPARVPRVNTNISTNLDSTIVTNNLSLPSQSLVRLQPKPATFSRNPISLHTLWYKYKFAIAGRKGENQQFFNSRDRVT